RGPVLDRCVPSCNGSEEARVSVLICGDGSVSALQLVEDEIDLVDGQL
ncbi:MAG: hypothetical protein V7636_636, partial [Actinomycetota bacterium]